MRAAVALTALWIAAGLLVWPGMAEADDGAYQRDLWSALRERFVQRYGQALIEDPRLGAAAEAAARDALVRASSRTATRRHLWREGVRDFEFLPLALVASEPPPVSAVLGLLDDPAVHWDRYNAGAVEVVRGGSKLAVVVLLTRRVAAFPRGDNRFPLVRLPQEFGSATLWVTHPDGVLEERTPDLNNGRWRLDLRTGPDQGAWFFELLGDGPRGPEVLALWHTEHGGEGAGRSVSQHPEGGKDGSVTPLDSAAWVRGSRPGPDRPPGRQDVESAEKRLWQLMQAEREAHGLPQLAHLGGLTRAARVHAADLQRGEDFGHQTSSGNALQRVIAEGLTPVRVLENVASAANVTEVHAAIVASPAHRANLLDPTINAAGVGVVVQRDGLGRWSVQASQVFGEMMAEATDDWDDVVLRSLNSRRVREQLPVIVRRELIDHLAQEAVDKLLAERRTTLTTEERKELAGGVRFHFMNARGVGVDLVVSTAPGRAGELAHAAERRFAEVGIGTGTLLDPIGDSPAGAVMVLLVFVER